MPKLLTSNHKLEKKAAELGYLCLGVSLLPHTVGGKKLGPTRCPGSSKGCRKVCLNWSGRGMMDAAQKARYERTELWMKEPERFKNQLAHEIYLAQDRARARGLKLAVRLNVFSDIAWESWYPELFTMFPNVQFYDYTKRIKRLWLDSSFPPNYHLTFSRSEDNDADCANVLRAGGVVNVVAESRDAVMEWADFSFRVRLVDGDEHDLTFLHKPGTVSWVRPKGRAGKDKTGFVLRD